MSSARERKQARATWPGKVVRDGRPDPATVDDPASAILAVFELSGWHDAPPIPRGEGMPGRVIRPGDR